MQEAGVQNAAEALRLLPPVNISGGAPFGASLRQTAVLRGLPAHYILTLLNGKRTMSEHFHTGTNLSIFPAEAISRIELTAKPLSSVYGSGAAGGIINIITRELEKQRTLSFDSSYGSFSTARAGITYGAKEGNIEYLLTGGAVNSDSYNRSPYRQQAAMARF